MKTRLVLSEFQAEQLKPFFGMLEIMNREGRPGMILAQIVKEKDRNHGWLDVRIIGHEMGKELQKCVAQTPGKEMDSELFEVLEPFEANQQFNAG